MTWIKHILNYETTDDNDETLQRRELYMDEIILPSDENNLTCLTEKAKMTNYDHQDELPPDLGMDSTTTHNSLKKEDVIIDAV